jgi:hypothetical protein
VCPCLTETVVENLFRNERTYSVVDADEGFFKVINLRKSVLYRMETCSTAMCQQQRNGKRILLAQLFPQLDMLCRQNENELYGGVYCMETL